MWIFVFEVKAREGVVNTGKAIQHRFIKKSETGNFVLENREALVFQRRRDPSYYTAIGIATCIRPAIATFVSISSARSWLTVCDIWRWGVIRPHGTVRAAPLSNFVSCFVQ
jgi:hypothetical protein